jgi:hypothetical protein
MISQIEQPIKCRCGCMVLDKANDGIASHFICKSCGRLSVIGGGGGGG